MIGSVLSAAQARISSRGNRQDRNTKEIGNSSRWSGISSNVECRMKNVELRMKETTDWGRIGVLTAREFPISIFT